MKRVLANTIEGIDYARAAHDIVAERWDNLDLTPFLVYMVDTCASSVLPFLADQFNVEGLRGFALAENETAQRELIKQSIAIHKFIGTPWAMREACRMIGFPVIILQEGVDTGNPDTDWARFTVCVDPGQALKITPETISTFHAFVNMYKPARCHIHTLGFHWSFYDKLFRDIDENRREVFELQIVEQTYIDYLVVIDSEGWFPIDSEFIALEYEH